MAAGKPWTYDELLIAMNLYCKLPFGQLRHGNPLIVEVARKLGRTPSSLSMKLCNLAALDPYHQARGVKGLSSTSKKDREIWDAFADNWGIWVSQAKNDCRPCWARKYLKRPSPRSKLAIGRTLL